MEMIIDQLICRIIGYQVHVQMWPWQSRPIQARLCDQVSLRHT